MPIRDLYGQGSNGEICIGMERDGLLPLLTLRLDFGILTETEVTERIRATMTKILSL